MDSPKTTRAGSRSRRKIFSCPVCDEVFIDEESLRRHELTHQNPEGEGESPPPEAEAPPVSSQEEESPSAVQEAPEAPAPRSRPLSAVRRQAAQQAAQVEPDSSFLPQDPTPEMPVDPDATLKVQQQHPSLAPLGWEGEAKKAGGGFGLGSLWGFIEDFAEWFVRGSTKTAGVVGFSLLSGVRLALWGLLMLATSAACVYAGIWFGRVYGPRLWGAQPVDQPVVPPVRTIVNSPESAQQAVRDLVVGFYASINDKEYRQAYDALSPAWQKEMSFEAFKNGYKDTQAASCSVKSVRSLAGGRYQMEIGLEVKEKGRTRYFKGTYVAVTTSAGWKLDEGAIR